MDWKLEFENIGALWQHDGNPLRPYALLTSGKISDFFFNGSKIIERPALLGAVVSDLIFNARKIIETLTPNVVIGPAVGAIPLVYEVARYLSPLTRAWFAEHIDGHNDMTFKRFEKDPHIQTALAVEDVITTGGSTLETIAALHRLDPKIKACPLVLCIVNRSGSMYLSDNRRILPILAIDAKTWERGKNPFTKDGQELVEPVRPKQHWEALTQQY